MIFTNKDIEQIKSKGLTLEKVNSQINFIISGVTYTRLIGSGNHGEGIIKLSKIEEQNYIDVFEEVRDKRSILKFVPASGAATRMFKFLFKFLEEYQSTKETINSYINHNKNGDLKVFLAGLEKMPFFEEVVHKVHEIIPNFNDLSYDEKRIEFIKTMLDDDRLNYSVYPKGLLPFHRYKDHVSTAFEEHLFEAALYASSNGEANLHFTISENHFREFNQEFSYIEEDLEEKTNKKFKVSFSYQKPSTDTIALTLENQCFRNNDGSLLFRAGGHGALIENLNRQDYDVIFIKNIDNVVVSKHYQKVAYYKKVLAGVLITVQKKLFAFLEILEKGRLTRDEIEAIKLLLVSELNIVLPDDFEQFSEDATIRYFIDKLNRPIRVCGIVKNEGEPGGGPFWVKDSEGEVSLQIVEFAQIDIKDEEQRNIVRNAVYFNPTDIVCGIKNYKGELFNLNKFVNPNAAFITKKSKDGQSLKALELPGLWNGSMAYWNSIYIEVPILTFNPVKTVNDFLKPEHQEI